MIPVEALMKRHTIIMTTMLALSVGFTGAGIAAENTAGAAAEKSFLWRATGTDGATVYLLGSVHALPRSAYPLAPAIEQAYAQSEVVVFEVDLDALESAGSRMMAAGALKPGQKLDEVLSPETRQQLGAYLDEAGLSIGAFSAMRPWMVALSLATLELMKAGYSPSQGLDVHLASRAAQDGKQIRALETADFQISLFTDMNARESESFLCYTLRDLRTIVPQLEEITAAWKHGDVETVSSLLGEAFEDEPELFARLVTERNESWLPTIRKMLDSPEVGLVVVGALHLVGDVGLVDRLREEGYEVEQL